ncbi:MAG TPA: orotidine-5'-phosphate decarboxylase [Candidatus Dormibacteraeota bacterium]
MSFAGRLREAITHSESILCVGLDPDLTTAPDAASAESFCAGLLDATLMHACAVKANIAFFEQHGSAGYAVLERLRARVPSDRLLIIDAKRGDIGSSSEAYARALFDVLGADAITANPLMGEDALRPLLDRPGRGCFLLTRTSNPGAADILEQPLSDGHPVYEHIACMVERWDTAGNAGLVVGATAPEAVARLRRRVPHLPFLIPGVGAQGGSLQEAVAAGLDGGGGGLLVAVSRGIAQAPGGAGPAATHYREHLERARQTAVSPPGL